VRRLEGLEPVTGWVLGEAPKEPLTIVENGVRMQVDVVTGHKTGFYLDQRDNRLLTRELAAGRATLNCFCYTGGFSLQALAGGPPRCLSIDSSGRRWPRPWPTWRSTRNSMPIVPNGERPTCSTSCAYLKAAGSAFDLIILDPPKFAPSAAHAERAARAYRDINASASACSIPVAC
jgi:23S rRNA (cytosine1962-C5)-methyltransferase